MMSFLRISAVVLMIAGVALHAPALIEADQLRTHTAPGLGDYDEPFWLASGQVILFADEPNIRGVYRGGERMLLNAIFLGPGFGSKPPVEW